MEPVISHQTGLELLPTYTSDFMQSSEAALFGTQITQLWPLQEINSEKISLFWTKATPPYDRGWQLKHRLVSAALPSSWVSLSRAQLVQPVHSLPELYSVKITTKV